MKCKLPSLITFMFLLFVVTTPGALKADNFDHGHTLYNDVAKTFVDEGYVDYIGLKKDSTQLNQYLAQLNKIDEKRFAFWEEKQQLAYLINLYNAVTLKLIIDNYPVKSIKKIGSFFRGPWEQPVVYLFGQIITLNHLEHEIIRKKYDEPRIHMALVCAAAGCPPLRSEAYIAEQLDAQLDDQTKKFLSNPIKFHINRKEEKVSFSPLFKWYGGDFVSKYTPQEGFAGFGEVQRATLNFCSLHLPEEDRIFLMKNKYSIYYLNYDWSLNERKGKE